MSNFNYDFISTNLERLWSFKISIDEKIALIGYGDDEGQLTQFDIENKEVVKSYWTEGSYTLSICFVSNSQAIVGTNNGFVFMIDLERKEIKQKLKISDKSIKDLKLSDNGQTIFAITSNEILLLNIETLEVLNQKEINFNPWATVVIPHTDFIVIGGSSNKLELLKSDTFTMIDSIICGEEYRDVSSILYDEESSLLVTGTESGTLDFWKITTNGFEKEKQFIVNDNMYWMQKTDDFIAFSTSTKDIMLFWIQEQKLLRKENALEEARFALHSINNETYLLHQDKSSNVSLSNLTNVNLDFFKLVDLPSRVKFIDFTSNGNIVAVTEEGIIVSNFMKQEEIIPTQYDFNSKDENIAVDKFVFNEIEESVALQCKDETIKVVSLEDTKIANINFSSDIYEPEIKDFYGDNVLLSSYKDICIVNIKTNQSQEIINDYNTFPSIKHIKLVNENKYAIVNEPDYMATPIIWDYLRVYDFDGNEISSLKLENVYNSMFVSNNKLITTSINDPSRIININTNSVEEFDIGYSFDFDDTIVFDNEKYCIRIAMGNHSNYYIICYDLINKNDNGDAQVMWKNEAPWLSSFVPLGYCRIDGYLYIINKDDGEIISLNISNGDMISSYRVQKNIVDIKMSNSGKYIAWRLKTGEFSYISYPFKSCEVSDE